MSNNNYGSAIFWWVAAISLAIVLFWGEPDIADALREKAIKWADMESDNEQ